MSKTKLSNHLPLWHDGLDYEVWSELDLGLNLNSALVSLMILDRLLNIS